VEKRRQLPPFEIESQPDVDSLMDHVIKGLHDASGFADAGIIYIYHQDSRQLIPRVAFGYTGSFNKISLGPGEGLPGRCLAEDQSILLISVRNIRTECEDTLRTKNLSRYRKMREGLPPVHSVIAVPLSFRSQPTGVMVLERFNPQQRRFNKSDLHEMELLGNRVSLMIEYLNLELNLKASNRSYRDLLGRFLANDEAERKRISREIHDEINHILLSVKLNLEDMESTLPGEMTEIKAKLKTLHSHVGKAFDNLHRLSFDLRPPGLDDMGLPQALDWYVNIIANEYRLPIKLTVHGEAFRKPAPVVETALLRIVQESLSNVIKHAGACQAKVTLGYSEQEIRLDVEDDGTGFNANELLNINTTIRNLGLLGMRERAEMCGGSLHITSAAAEGTRVSVVIPVGSFDWGTY